jgi:hypothetical protein
MTKATVFDAVSPFVLPRRDFCVSIAAAALASQAARAKAASVTLSRLGAMAVPADGTMQAFTFDPLHRYVYVTRVLIETSATPGDAVVVSRHTIDGRLVDQSKPSTQLGHGSGLAIETYRPDPIFWSGGGDGRGASRFRYRPNGAPEILGSYPLWPTGWHSAQSTVSNDGMRVVSQAIRASGVRRIRVFDRLRLTRSFGSDPQEALLSEFPLDADQLHLAHQGIVATNRRIAVLSGDTRTANGKILCVYTMSGSLVSKSMVEPSKITDSTYTEPEGLSLVEGGRIAVGFSIGQRPNKTSQIWITGAAL